MASNPDPVADAREAICSLLARLDPPPTEAWIPEEADKHWFAYAISAPLCRAPRPALFTFLPPAGDLMPSDSDPVADAHAEICLLLARLHPAPSAAWVAAEADKLVRRFRHDPASSSLRFGRTPGDEAAL